MKTPVIIGIVVLVLLVAGGVWYAYTNPTIAAELGLQHSAAQMNDGSGMHMGTTTPYGHGGMQGGFATGSIEVLNGSDFTITLANGDTKDITLAATTTIQDYATASSTPTTITPDQLSVGEQVQVIGSLNSDGSITARFVRTGAVPARGAGMQRGGSARGSYGQGGAQPAQ